MSVSEYWYIKVFKDAQLYLVSLKPFEFEYSTVKSSHGNVNLETVQAYKTSSVLIRREQLETRILYVCTLQVMQVIQDI